LIKADTGNLLRQISEDRALGSQLLFSHRHPQETPKFHVQVMDLWRGADEFVLIEAFREAGKSTLSEEFLLLEACFGNFRYALVFGETYTKAVQRLSAIKHEALRNTKLHALFGKLKGEIWSENAIVLANGCRIEAHGWEEEIRGYKWLDARPDRAYLDDIENKSMVRDTASVDASWRKLNTELIPALDKEHRKVRVTGTPLADDCLVNRCKKSPEWVHASFPICYTPDGKVGAEAIDDPAALATWPERYSMEWIRKEKARFESGGLLREYVQEYMLLAASTQGKPFAEEEIRYLDVAPGIYTPKVYICDPARTTNVSTSDRTGRVVASRIGTTIYVHESSGEYWKPDAIVSGCFDTSERFDDCEIAIERNSLDEWLMQPMRNEMLRRGKSLNVQAILAPPDRSKEQFILGLQPFFKAGDIVLVGGPGKHPQLKAEIVNFPSGKRDILNALAYVQRVFGGQPVYPEFGQDNIVMQWVPDRSDQLAVGFHSTSSETACVLVSISGRRMTVLADWVSSLSPLDAVRDMFMLVSAAYPNRHLTTWVPADVYDQQGRVALMDALKSVKAEVHKGGYITASRGILADKIRMEIQRRRLFLVDSNARATLQALASTYKIEVGSDGRAKGEPVKNVSRTLAEALECLTFGIEQSKSASELPDGFGESRNAQGVEYFSALRPRR
jgi:hypothetical protein